MTTPSVCKHCGKKRVNRPRGLCWSCYYRPGIRDRYPSTSKYARRGAGHSDGQGELPMPTTAAPGSPEKLAVLAERVQRGQVLFHPFDARYPGDLRPWLFLHSASFHQDQPSPRNALTQREFAA